MSPRQKAEACFALARSTTFEAERDNAVTRGIAVAEKAGLDLDLFDIPGRVRQPRRRGQPDLFGGNVRVIIIDEVGVGDALRSFAEALRADAAFHRPTWGDLPLCPGGCGKTILFGDGCVECDRAGRL